MTSASGFDVSGIVLAGGRSRRLGRDKALEPIDGQPLIQRVIERVALVSAEVVVVVADQLQGQRIPLRGGHRLGIDRYSGKGPLGGIFSGLTEAQHQWAVVVACDMPFLNLPLLRYMLSLCQGHDAVVPVLAGRPEPTHAVYSKSCIPYIEQRLLSNDLKISGFFDQVWVRYLTEKDILPFDPEYLSFFNANTPGDMDKAVTLIQ